MRALVVDDVVEMAETVAIELAAAGFDVDVATSGIVALRRFAEAPADIVITDLRMSDGDGFEVLSSIKRIDRTVPVIVMTAMGGVEPALEAMRRGAFDYLTKPFTLNRMRAVVEQARDARVRAPSRPLRRAQVRPEPEP